MSWNSAFIWHFCLTFYILTIEPCECKPKFCNDVLRDRGKAILEEKVLDVASEECPLSASMLRAYRVVTNNNTAVSSKYCEIKIHLKKRGTVEPNRLSGTVLLGTHNLSFEVKLRKKVYPAAQSK